MNSVIKSALKYRPSENWIANQSRLPWLKLNINVPAIDIYYEALPLLPLFVNHRENDQQLKYQHCGWKSLTIYGAHHQITEHTQHTYGWTNIAEQCPVTVDFIKQHWEITQSTGRIRFMLLEPGGHIMPHSDRTEPGLKESNVAVFQPANCEFRFTNYGTVPFSTGTAFLLDTSQDHLVYNDSCQARLHIIVHGQLKLGTIKNSYEQSFYC